MIGKVFFMLVGWVLKLFQPNPSIDQNFTLYLAKNNIYIGKEG